MVVTFES